ncbi:4-coumarate-CoA ligase [Rhizodiscina lignyota]|uniref:4-coumarate-CoA ligase n=1 Tax=Rhizodiscina lignyota TaxID=1504668 RepID=A0A9P4ILM8_9PEZI|nr:4-coumarate-CoA ligase [Rhizodiscina lignyota]
MIFKSRSPDINPTPCNILDFLFPEGAPVSEQPLWIDAYNESTSVSPKQLLVWVRRFGLGLSRLGVGVGDSILIYSPNHVFIPAAYLSSVCLGAAFSGASPAFTVPELVHQMKVLGPKIFYLHPSLIQKGLAAAEQCGFPKEKIFLASDVFVPPQNGLRDWRALMATEEESKNWRWKPFTPEESRNVIATVNFSSGTTGLPKGVAVSHSNLIHNVTMVIETYNYGTPPERWLGFLPLYHAYGQAYAVLVATKASVPIYIMPSFNFVDYLKFIQKYKITRLQTVPPILIMLDKRPETKHYDLSSVREILCGAAPLSKELQHAIERKLNVRVTQGWGLSETTFAATGVPTGMQPLTGSSGLLLPSTELRLIDDDGKEVGVGERGEAYVRGPQIAKGYWRNEKATAETFEDGWLKSGDVAVVNEDGYMWIVDRKKELIKVNALQVSPAELEAVLIENPDIDDAAVVGIELSQGERPRAYVKLAEGARARLNEAQIQEWIKPRVAKHKWLEGGVMIVPEIPKLMSGKIQRKVMREWAKKDAERLGAATKAKL